MKKSAIEDGIKYVSYFMCSMALVARARLKVNEIVPRVGLHWIYASRGSNSSFTKWSRNIELLDTSVDGSATQERNLDFLCIEKVGVKSLPNKSLLIWT